MVPVIAQMHPYGRGFGRAQRLALLVLALFIGLLPATAPAAPNQSQPQFIVFLGDSITHQCDWARLLERPEVDNQGIDGDTSAGVLERLDRVIARRPAKVFLMIGINDLRRARGRAGAAEAVLANQERIMSRLRAGLPQAQVYVQSVLPVSRSFFSFLPDNQVIMDLNRRLKETAAEKGCAFVDLYPFFLDQDGALDKRYTYDGLHLNAQGYQVWKQAITPHL